MLQYIILMCLFFFSLTIVYTALILRTMVLFSTVKSINEYLCISENELSHLVYARRISLFVVEKLEKKDIHKCIEICVLFLLLLK